MAENVFILGGSGNKIDPNVSGVTLIACSDNTISESDNGKTIIQNGAAVIHPNGNLEASLTPTTLNRTADFSTDYAHQVYFCDATAGNIIVTVMETGIAYTFVKTDPSANTVRLDPNTGTINGAANFTLTTQYQKVTVVFDGTNFYV